MVQVPRPTLVRGPTLIRLLARIADVNPAPSNQPLPDRLSQWLDWNHAIALSTALGGQPSLLDAVVSPPAGAEDDECARARRSLVQGIAEDCAPAEGAGQPSDADDGTAAAPDYAVYRQRYLSRQRAMQSAAGRLRGRLRDLLARTSPGMARLAEVDAVMEQALSPREHSLLAVVPNLLGGHFERLSQGARPTKDRPGIAHPPASAPSGWLEVFRRDMQSLLLAELDVRFQPLEGLLAALRAP